MGKERLLAFSDGVIAILITLMVLELRVPHGSDWAAISSVLPIFFMYMLSFVFLAIYWNNHHHLLSLAERVNGQVLWANTHLLFWLSLVPFVTRWMGENNFEPLPVAVYGAVLLLAAGAFTILVQVLIGAQGNDTRLRDALGSDLKGKVSLVLYAAGVALAFPARWLALAIYVLVALLWLVPDPRIEKVHRRN
jgi:TMEM175 potassium channel family protein